MAEPTNPQQKNEERGKPDRTKIDAFTSAAKADPGTGDIYTQKRNELQAALDGGAFDFHADLKKEAQDVLAANPPKQGGTP